jgi:hypothetical protein
MHPGNASVDGSEQFMSSNCHPWLMAIVDVKKDRRIQGGKNKLRSDQPVTIQSGQQYDQVNLTFNQGIGVVVK